MPTPISIRFDELELAAELNDTPCARAIASILPIRARPDTWGEEFYFDIDLVHPEEEGAATEMEIGEIGYWPPGTALAIFFGRTPASTGGLPVAASAVNRVGRILDDATVLKSRMGTRQIAIERRT